MPKVQTAKLTLTPDEVKRRTQKIEEIGKKFSDELNNFKQKQRALLEQFIKALEQKKIEEIQKSLQK